MRLPIAMCAAALSLGISTRAEAFCGFYVGGAGAQMFNNATQVVLMRHGTTTVLSMQNNYQGPPEGFALVVPVPVVIQEKQVKTLPRELFTKIDTLGAPRLVEYWEQDPCRVDRYDEYDLAPNAPSAAESVDEDSADRDYQEYKVKVEAKFSVGEYDIAVLSAQESTGLDRYLRANKYEIPPGAEPLLRPYVEQGTKFFVAKVDPKKVRFENGMATLSPLRFHYESPELVLPVRLGLANSSGTQDLIVNIVAPGNTRYEAANYPNITIPTNLRVNDSVRARFGEFYAALFDHAIEKVPHAVVTEYAWNAGSCDPCPGPTLDQNDLATLGSDVLMQTYQNVDPYNFTLTRLHARYGKELKDDLVFRSVDGIVGGTGMPDATGNLNTELQRQGMNMFQGRYVILHPWAGSVACESPQRGRWGGPIDGNQIATQAAQNLAFAPRGKVSLASMVEDEPVVNVLGSKPERLPLPIRQPQGCGCQSGGGVASAGGLAVLGVLLRRRRRAKTVGRV